MNTFTTHNAAFGILALTSLLSFSGCSQKPSSEEIAAQVAAQVKAAIEAEKAKEQAASTSHQTATSAVAVTSPPTVATTPKPTVKPRHVTKPRLVAKSGSVAGPEPITPAQPAQPEQAAPVQKIVCGNCGVVISIREIEQEGKGSGLGVIAGGAAGGLIANQVGQGSGRDLATLAGVVGGALAGNKIEKTMKKSKVYDVTVQLESGEVRILRYGTVPGVVAGDKVKVEGEQILRQ